MRSNGNFIEVDHYQQNKSGNIVCGDCFASHKFKEGGRVITVLSDGLGSGIKASVLSTITSSMSLNFTAMNDDIVAASASILRTLPVDAVRKVGYSTFCICDIDCFGKIRIVEYETPSFYLWRNGALAEVQKEKIPVERDDVPDTFLWLSEFVLQREDRVVFFSDGVSQSGMGSRAMPFGWDRGVGDFITETIGQEPGISAKELSFRIVKRAEQNDGLTLRDDTSCGVIYMRRPRNLLICTGPPYEERNDRVLGNRIREFQGRKIICGGTTAQIVSRETGAEIRVDMTSTDRELPPIARMEGVDLVTEGILTLSKLERILTGEEAPKKGPAAMIAQMLSDSDKITFLVGTRINTAHQDPTLPVELEIRRNVVKKLRELLESRWLKDVDITYI